MFANYLLTNRRQIAVCKRNFKALVSCSCTNKVDKFGIQTVRHSIFVPFGS